MSRIVVLGSGAWGTAIALSLCRRGGHEVTLWAHSDDEARQIDGARENTLFLPGFPLPAELTVTADVRSDRRGARSWSPSFLPNFCVPRCIA